MMIGTRENGYRNIGQEKLRKNSVMLELNLKNWSELRFVNRQALNLLT